jgi:UDP-glucuronate 4-epimerase
MKLLVTGTAGFIGFHLAQRLLDRGEEVYGVDNLNDYYDVNLKLARLARLDGRPGFTFGKLDLADRAAVPDLFNSVRPQRVIHLAAQAGVRYSLTHPHAYVDSNLVAFVNILEGCRHQGIEHLVYASSSSVYGANTKLPFSVSDNVDHPVSLYAATKKANELMAHTYSHLFRLPTTGLRFFTVYGPWGRPDMSYVIFTKAILEGHPIDVFNQGHMQRDFTYIDDIIEGVVRVSDRIPGQESVVSRQSSVVSLPLPSAAQPVDAPPTAAPPPLPNSLTHQLTTGYPPAPYALYNIGNNHPVDLLRFIAVLEDCLGKKAEKRFLPMQPGDVPATYADVDDLIRDVAFKPATPIETGVKNFVAWYRDYYGLTAH